jgi:tRNA (guanine-N7-)-methyltransferase
VSKGKLFKFAEMETFPNVLQPAFEDVFGKEHSLKGKWKELFFKNSNPITLELGCGKGEYAVGMARIFPDRNFIGIDIKGARIWKGAKRALQEKLPNVAFLRTRIDFITSFFAADEIDEIWITFPDPQLKKDLKKLTSSRFLNRYNQFLKSGGTLNLKTDSRELYDYTCLIANYNKLRISAKTDNLYHSKFNNEILSIKTFYESMWLDEGLKIHYIQFQLNRDNGIQELPGE